ncbi:DUF2637 domain-containing protein [Streptomyces sp. NPDC006193]|uniref:DUF2637 domain-containing protein n=1 Tax=Streptomyces sp. NPDC006193 TaxID=3155717 RepID=UPI0033A05594
MHDEWTGHHPDPPVGYADGYAYGHAPGHRSGGGRHRGPAETSYPPLIPPDSGWDPAEELAFLLRDAVEEQQARIPAARSEDVPAGRDLASAHDVPAGRDLASAHDVPADGSPASAGDVPADGGAETGHDVLTRITAEPPPVHAPPRGHRRVRRRQRPSGLRIASCTIAATATVIASAVSIFGGLIAYDPLRFVAMTRTQSSSVTWWPVLVFGPWLVASLSILRASLHQRRAFHSWCVLLAFSAIGMALCVAQAPRNVLDTAAAALPGFASLACFQQVVRQITLTRPPRRTLPRHRLRSAEPPQGEAAGRPARDAASPAGGGRPRSG